MQYIYIGFHLSDGVIGLCHSFSEVSRLSSSAWPAGWGSAFCDGEAVQWWSGRKDVIHHLCCGLQWKQTEIYCWKCINTCPIFTPNH